MTESTKQVAEKIAEITQKFNEQLEIYAAAFVKHMGTDKAAEYVLVQQTFPSEHKVVYRYEHRDTIGSLVKHKEDIQACRELLAEVEVFSIEKDPSSILVEIPKTLQKRLVNYLKNKVDNDPF